MTTISTPAAPALPQAPACSPETCESSQTCACCGEPVCPEHDEVHGCGDLGVVHPDCHAWSFCRDPWCWYKD